MAAQAIRVYQAAMNRMIITAAVGALAIVVGSSLAFAPASAQAQPKPDTEFCAKMRAKDPGGICTAKGEYVTPEKVYKPDGTVINRSTGDCYGRLRLSYRACACHHDDVWPCRPPSARAGQRAA